MSSGYMKIREENETRLVLSREPSSRAWAILIGLVSLGISAVLYINDYLLWRLGYLSVAVFVGVSCFEDWEKCEFDKEKGELRITKTSLIEKIMPLKDKKIVTASLAEVTSVRVEEEDVCFSGRGHIVVLSFESGYTLGVTEIATMADRSVHERVAQKISSFLGLGSKKKSHAQKKKPETSSETTGEVSEAPVDAGHDSASSSDEGFEKIGEDDLPIDLDLQEMNQSGDLETLEPPGEENPSGDGESKETCEQSEEKK